MFNHITCHGDIHIYVFTTTVDVKPIGPEQSTVGLAALNQLVFELFGINPLWYDITDWFGVIAILFAFAFTTLYIFFEFVIINYRPIILHTSLETSYPSSRTMIVMCIIGTAMV